MKILSGIWVPHPPPYKEEVGLEYAQALARKTQGLSLALTIIGWLFVVLGALLAIGGSVLGSDETKVASETIWDELMVHRGLLCSTLAIVFAGAGWQVLDRASAATKVASISTVQFLLPALMRRMVTLTNLPMMLVSRRKRLG